MSLCLEPTTRPVADEEMGPGDAVFGLITMAASLYVITKALWRLALTFF